MVCGNQKSGWILILVPALWRQGSIQNCSLGQNYFFFSMACEQDTQFVSPLLDVKRRKRAEAVWGDISTPCQGEMFLSKE